MGWNAIETDTHCEPLWTEWQDNCFVVWCKEYTVLKPTKPLKLFLATTGERVADGLSYVGTATTPDRTFVAHLFQQ